MRAMPFFYKNCLRNALNDYLMCKLQLQNVEFKSISVTTVTGYNVMFLPNDRRN